VGITDAAPLRGAGAAAPLQVDHDGGGEWRAHQKGGFRSCPRREPKPLVTVVGQWFAGEGPTLAPTVSRLSHDCSLPTPPPHARRARHGWTASRRSGCSPISESSRTKAIRRLAGAAPGAGADQPRTDRPLPPDVDRRPTSAGGRLRASPGARAALPDGRVVRGPVRAPGRRGACWAKGGEAFPPLRRS